MNFYKIICIITIILLIACLTSMAVAMQTSSKKVVFPPNLSKCPDFYKDDANDISLCVAMYETNNTTSECRTPNFSDSKYTNPGMGPTSGICAKKKWAQGCNVNWDGITNNSAVCYQTND